jgi:hypothetical protein
MLLHLLAAIDPSLHDAAFNYQTNTYLHDAAFSHLPAMQLSLHDSASANIPAIDPSLHDVASSYLPQNLLCTKFTNLLTCHRPFSAQRSPTYLPAIDPSLHNVHLLTYLP